MQTPMMVALICLCFILAGTFVGVWLRKRLPEHHLSKESESVVKLGVGLIATLSALVLGLLISSAKSTYDAKVSEVNQITANIILIDQLLSEYGPDVRPAREKLRSGVQGMVQKMWNEGNEKSANSSAFTPTAASMETWRLVQSLPTQTEMQRGLSSQITEAAKISRNCVCCCSPRAGVRSLRHFSSYLSFGWPSYLRALAFSVR